MPIYEYECPKCGTFEVFQKISERPLKADPLCTRSDCPKCAKRLVSAAAFHLKGSGWYKTDYASPGSSSNGSSSGSDSSGSSDTSDKNKKKEKAAESANSSVKSSSAQSSG